MEIKHVIDNVYDVFTGYGWENHTRIKFVKTNHGNFVHYVSGIKLPKIDLIRISKTIEKDN